jgi:hypothetical protein
MESILSDGTLEFDDDGGGFSGRTPPEPLDPLGPDRPPAPGPLPWPHEPDWKRPVYIGFELGGHPAWPATVADAACSDRVRGR